MALNILIEEQKQGVYVVKLAGELDSNTYMMFQDKLRPFLVESTEVIIFDMAGLNYISSMGLAEIFKIRKKVEAYKGSIVISNLQPQIKKVFEIVKALPSEKVFESREEVDNYLNAMQRKEIKKQKEETEW
ncbi:STAS domain-containing protein [bacterium]|jgi:anti-anti-sigma regulatory factor|nr:STAS domain-containing protein [bacterium]